MKIPLLLAQYLREQKLLNVPGIGTLRLSGNLPEPGENPETNSAHIELENKEITEPDGHLIDYIKEHTGKIKPLAIADLDSYISSGLQLLNIGKPFYMEGIGTIQKSKQAKYEFSLGEITSIRLEPASNQPNHAEKKTSVLEEGKYEPKSNPLQIIVFAALLLGGLTIVVGGGYYLYNQNNIEPTIQNESNFPETSTTTVDSLTTGIDSAALLASQRDAGSYKFILETANKKRALRRYAQLKSYMMDIKMETSDSISFKLYFRIPALPSDTTRIKDSLYRYYLNKVTIEK